MNYRQQGATLIGFALFWGLLAFALYILMCITPLYLENYDVKSSLKSLQSDPAIFSPTTFDVKNAIKSGFQKRLRVNNVKRVTAENLELTLTSTGYQAKVAYDASAHLFGNIHIVIHFSDEIMIKRT